ncbi:Pectinesterase, catalytic [Corchorus capsularis]|uniref:Pectinesterase n=1 Tax=Corchorus capsularis TaxID=210143 RepID=A0A1R3IUP3_COCAP|nr:Pectinesterase, catalytic [Corchorus capsularis]
MKPVFLVLFLMALLLLHCQSDATRFILEVKTDAKPDAEPGKLGTDGKPVTASGAKVLDAKDVRKMKIDVITKRIIVDQSGNGNFITIQKAIDSVPSRNAAWTRIHVKAGIYNEKVNIPQDKPRILLEGESRRNTIIQFGDGGDSIQSSTFSLSAEEVVVMDITFQNTHNLKPGNPLTWAPAALINADKAAFYRCGFISLQDTLTDSQGRHYFESCYIEGALDFIWGNGRSIYQNCILNVTASLLGRGQTAYITSQGRDSSIDASGFVFKYCLVLGTGPAYLGRAYKKHARVLFYRTKMSNIIAPKGWSAWNYAALFLKISIAIDCDGGSRFASTIVADKSGHGQFQTVQSAINSIPPNNNRWIKLQIKPGVYKEKVNISRNKPCIFLEGQDPSVTIITFDAHQRTDLSTTFTFAADNIVAKGITFKNSFNHPWLLKRLASNKVLVPGVTQAVAARILGDKSAFFWCRFLGLQDTLWSARGRHYFSSCYIEGGVDFIFGNGQSFFEDCSINVTGGAFESQIGKGYITAQGRESPNDPSGFVFKRGRIFGTLKHYLGRAWGPYARVIFHHTTFDSEVVPLGWFAWLYPGKKQNFMYAEVNCQGPGSDTSGRVPWEKKLNPSQVQQFSRSSFIDHDGWIDKLPLS